MTTGLLFFYPAATGGCPHQYPWAAVEQLVVIYSFQVANGAPAAPTRQWRNRSFAGFIVIKTSIYPIKTVTYFLIKHCNRLLIFYGKRAFSVRLLQRQIYRLKSL
jgi:hypothetical protein